MGKNHAFAAISGGVLKSLHLRHIKKRVIFPRFFGENGPFAVYFFPLGSVLGPNCKKTIAGSWL